LNINIPAADTNRIDIIIFHPELSGLKYPSTEFEIAAPIAINPAVKDFLIVGTKIATNIAYKHIAKLD
jgi:hypothetical protein